MNHHGGGFVDFIVDDAGRISVLAYSKDGKFYGQYYRGIEATKRFLATYIDKYRSDKLPVDDRRVPTSAKKVG